MSRPISDFKGQSPDTWAKIGDPLARTLLAWAQGSFNRSTKAPLALDVRDACADLKVSPHRLSEAYNALRRLSLLQCFGADGPVLFVAPVFLEEPSISVQGGTYRERGVSACSEKRRARVSLPRVSLQFEGA